MCSLSCLIARLLRHPHRLSQQGCALLLLGHAVVVSAGSGTDTPAPRAQGPASTLAAMRLYRSREEQREAGLQTDITDWLTVSGLAEAELTYDRFAIERGRDDASGRDEAITLQLGALIDLFTWVEAEVILEYESDTGQSFVEEAFITLEQDPWELSIGRQYTPFGVFLSDFVTGPLIEFGETRSNEAVLLSYGPSDALDLSATL